VGRSREYVSNSIRLLALPDYMLDALRTNDMSEGHARTLLMLNDRPEEQDVVFREILLKRLSVREVEKIARGIATEKVRKKELIDDGLLEMEKQFTNTLGTRVSITKTEFGGRLTIDYFSVEDLESMLERMKKDALVTARTAVPADYKDESKDSLVSEAVDEEEQTLAELARATGIEPIVRTEPATPAPVVAPAPLPAVPVEVPVLPVSTPPPAVVPTVTVPTPAPVQTGAKPSLRDQLASLLGNRAPVAESPVAPDVSTPTIPAPQPRPVLNEPLAHQTDLPVESGVGSAAPTPDTAKDESDLYSINRFTI
jgi:HTH domain found in ParB protein